VGLRGGVGVLLLAAALTGCNSTVVGRAAPAPGVGNGLPATPTASPENPNAPVTLTLMLLSGSGVRELNLIDAYRRVHPNVTVRLVEAPPGPAAYWLKVQVALGLSDGPYDLFTVPEDQIGLVTANPPSGRPRLWADLTQYGAGQLRSTFFPASWAAASTADGKVYGLGLDLAPTAICYRRDLLASAGLPTDRAALAGQWTSWAAYLASGRQFAARSHGPTRFADSPASLFRGIVGGLNPLYYSTSGQPIYATNPTITQAWNATVQAIHDNLVLPAGIFTPEWMTALAAGRTATVLCAPWMLALIQAQGRAGAGQWDVVPAPVPGQWGSSYLSVPANSQHPRAAYELAAWLTAAGQRAGAYPRLGAFPANRVAAQSSGVAAATNAFFNGAPVGRSFGAAAAALPPAPVGPRTDTITDSFGEQLTAVAASGVAPAAAWSRALSVIHQVTGN
jgi:cellobiose transport system substrate-binding protein